jgi:phosphate:Na+ symporter
MGHTIFNVLGTCYILPIVYLGLYSKLILWIAPFELSATTIAAAIALSHTTFNVTNTIIFTPLIGFLEKVVLKIMPVKEEEKAQKPVILEKHLLSTPVIALEQTKREIIRMAKTARKCVRRSVNGIISNDRRLLASVRKTEDFIDDFQLEITTYLSELSRKQLSDQVSNELPVLLHAVNDLERVGDHAVNIVEIAERKIEQKIAFSGPAHMEIANMRKEADQMFDSIITALEEGDKDAAMSALTNEKNLNTMQVDFRRSHVDRMSQGQCTANAGLIFIDLVDNIEKIGDHLTNIAQAAIGGLRWDGFEESGKPKAEE